MDIETAGQLGYRGFNILLPFFPFLWPKTPSYLPVIRFVFLGHLIGRFISKTDPNAPCAGIRMAYT